MPTYLAVDTETTGTAAFHGCKPFFVSTCDHRGKLKYWEFPVDPFTREPNIPRVKALEIKTYILSFDLLVFHHAKFDVRMLSTIGIDLTPYWDRIHDTLLLSHVLDSSEQHGLKPLCVKYLDMPDDDQDELKKAVQKCRLKGKRLGYNLARKGLPGAENYNADYWLPKAMDPSNKLVATYGGNDAKRTIKLFTEQVAAAIEEGLVDQYEYERQLLPIIYRMEERGVSLRPGVLNREAKRFRETAEVVNATLTAQAANYKLPSFNVESTNQLRTLLYDKMRFDVPKLTKNKNNPQASTDKEALETLWVELGNHVDERKAWEPDHGNKRCPKTRFLYDLKRYRGAAQASEYLDAYQRLLVKKHNPVADKYEYFLHPSVNQTGTATTRASSQDPNEQNISEKEEMNLRECFGPREGFFWYDVDYSNLEMRIFAVLADERSLIETFEQGGDVHLTITCRVWGVTREQLDKTPGGYKKDPRYKRTKNFLFAMLYGAGESRADLTLGMSGGYAKIRNLFPGIDRLMTQTIASTRKLGYVTTLFGYRLYAPRSEAYKAVNYLIQGTAGGVLKHGILNLDQALPVGNKYGSQLIMTIHDQNVIESLDKYRTEPKLAKLIVNAMEEPGLRISIPTPVKAVVVTKKWSESKPLPFTLAS